MKRAPFKVKTSTPEPEFDWDNSEVACAAYTYGVAPFRQVETHFVTFSDDPAKKVWRLRYSGNKPHRKEYEEVALNALGSFSR